MKLQHFGIIQYFVESNTIPDTSRVRFGAGSPYPYRPDLGIGLDRAENNLQQDGDEKRRQQLSEHLEIF